MSMGPYLLLLGTLFSFFGLIYFLDPGKIQITWLGFEFHLSALVGLLGVFSLFCFYKILCLISSWILKICSYWASFFKKRKNKETDDDLFKLARVSIEAGLWGDARSYLMLLLKKDPTPQVYHLLAILELEETHNAKAAIAWLEKSLICAYEKNTFTQ